MGETFVKRNEDMSPDGFLKIIRQSDGDMIVSLYDGKSPGDMFPSVEFCTSGGRSPHTRRALENLMLAMEKDNLERPIIIQKDNQ